MDTKKPVGNEPVTACHTIVVNGTFIRVKSVFGNVPIEKALANIARRKLAKTIESEKTASHC